MMIRYSPNERIKSIINVIMLRKNAKNLFIFAFKIDFATNIKANPNDVFENIYQWKFR